MFGSFNKGIFKRKRIVFWIEAGNDSFKSSWFFSIACCIRALRRWLWRRSSCARARYPVIRMQILFPPSLMLMSPSNFHRIHIFLYKTHTHAITLWWWSIPIYNVSFHFFHTKLIPQPPVLLLCSLYHHYIRLPAHPRHHWLANCRPCVLYRDARQRKRHSSGFRPPLLGFKNLWKSKY